MGCNHELQCIFQDLQVENSFRCCDLDKDDNRRAPLLECLPYADRDLHLLNP